MSRSGWRATVLRLTRCPRCDYDLASLPRRHRCPECGFAYDESMFVLAGWRVPEPGRSWRRLLLVFGGLALVLLLVRKTLGVPAPVVWGILLAALAGYAVLEVYVRLRGGSGGRALVRYLITSDGVARVGPSGARIYLWRNYSHLMLLPDGAGAWRLHLYPAWWHLFGPPIVNARLECAEAEAEAVQREIQRRISAARRAEAESGP